MASPGNRHCANCIGALSFPVASVGDWKSRGERISVARIVVDLKNLEAAVTSRRSRFQQTMTCARHLHIQSATGELIIITVIVDWLNVTAPG